MDAADLVFNNITNVVTAHCSHQKVAFIGSGRVIRRRGKELNKNIVEILDSILAPWQLQPWVFVDGEESFVWLLILRWTGFGRLPKCH